MNKELIHFPDGVSNRTEAIRCRIEHAGIARKINEKQVRALRFMLTGSPEDILHIQSENRLDEWCRDNLEWVRETFGKDNLVSAVLHMDEKTPHIHATVVPIVQGERRKAKTKQKNGRKKYRKKNLNIIRLCDGKGQTHRLSGQLFGTDAEIRFAARCQGLEAKNITTQQYYRELFVENEHLKEEIQEQEHERQEVYEKVRDLYDRKDEAREKFLDMDRHVKDKKEELATVETRLQKAKQDYEPYRVQEELSLIHELFPMMKEQLRIVELCRKIGLAVESVRSLLAGITLTAKSFSFFSPEHKQKFKAEDVEIKIEKEADNSNKLRVNINGMDVLE